MTLVFDVNNFDKPLMENAKSRLGCLFFLNYISSILSASCPVRCQWISWQEWSDCSRLCAGGTRTRDRLFCCRSDLAHDIRACMDNCGMDYHYSDFLDSENCNTVCYNGGTYVSNGYCRCPDRYKGTCCNDVVTCGQPSSVSNGIVTGNDFTFAGQVHYTCNKNYNMTDPSQAIRTCTKYGYWSGSSPTCLYATSCDSSPCKNDAQCSNLLGDYRCDCETGWAGKNCEVDIQPPVVNGCPTDIKVTVSSMTSNQSWAEPNITDPHGTEVRITKNYEISAYEFPWGEHTIQYNAVKLSNGLRAGCTFKISVKPIPCKKLDPPENGVILCNGWRTEYTQVCMFACKQNYTLPPGFKANDINVCGATGHWLPPKFVEQCVPEKVFPDREAGQFPTCTSASDKQGLAKTYIDILNASYFNYLCQRNLTNCNPENVIMTC